MKRGPYALHFSAAAALAVTLCGAAAVPAGAQDVLDRSPGISGGWVGIPWTVHVELPHRFRAADQGVGATGLVTATTFTGAVGLPWSSLAGVSLAIQSPTAPGEPDEIQPFLRHRLLDGNASFADVAATGAWNSAAGSVDGEALLARRVGSVRMMGVARWFSDARGRGDRGGAVAAGAVWHPLPRNAPLALAGDVAVPLGLEDETDLAWSAGVQLGIPFTAMTLSVQATNTAAATLQGASFAVPSTRYGFELTAPIPAGFLLGGYPDRETAVEAVVEEPDEPADVVVDIRRYAYGPVRTVIPAGAVVEWVNRDAVVHTATAEDGAWDSGGMKPGSSWRARFDEPGVYPYYCGPHPFMKGVVIVE